MSSTNGVSMWPRSDFSTNAEYSPREAKRSIARNSTPGAAGFPSDRSSTRAKRIPVLDSRSARSASAGFAVSTQHSVTDGSSSIGSGSGARRCVSPLARGRNRGRHHLPPEQHCEADQQRGKLQRGAVERREADHARHGIEVRGNDEDEDEAGGYDHRQRSERYARELAGTEKPQRHDAVPEQVPIREQQVAVDDGPPRPL